MTPELIALLEDALQLPVLERKIQKGALFTLSERTEAKAKSCKIQDRIRAALAEAKTQTPCQDSE